MHSGNMQYIFKKALYVDNNETQIVSPGANWVLLIGTYYISCTLWLRNYVKVCFSIIPGLVCKPHEFRSSLLWWDTHCVNSSSSAPCPQLCARVAGVSPSLFGSASACLAPGCCRRKDASRRSPRRAAKCSRVSWGSWRSTTQTCQGVCSRSGYRCFRFDISWAPE